jgi:hypothetical protein
MRRAPDVLRAFAVLAATRVVLRTLGWELALGLLDPRRLARRPGSPSAARRRSARDVAAAVADASRLLPGTSSCLAQALAARLLLRREGLPVEIRIGVGRTPPGGLKAHAWVESDGEIVLGDPASQPGAPYAPFPRPIW